MMQASKKDEGDVVLLYEHLTQRLWKWKLYLVRHEIEVTEGNYHRHRLPTNQLPT